MGLKELLNNPKKLKEIYDSTYGGERSKLLYTRGIIDFLCEVYRTMISGEVEEAEKLLESDFYRNLWKEKIISKKDIKNMLVETKKELEKLAKKSI